MSVNVGLPREVEWKGAVVRTSIFKSPVAGPTACRRLNLDGDLQSDLEMHGGPDKAVYAYRTEHYAFWREELPGVQLPWGSFGENLTIDGLPDEGDLHIGDRLRVGSAVLRIAQPRLPCAKLALRFGRPDMVKRFLASGRTGFYFAVVSEGIVEAGDEVTFVARDSGGVSVAEITRLYAHARNDVPAMRRAVEVEALPDVWRSWFRKRLAGTPSA